MSKVIHVSIGIIINHEGKILITQRAKTALHGGYWEFPGGKVEAQESPEIALVREIYEEVGLEIASFRYLGTVSYAYETGKVKLYAYLIKGNGYQGIAECLEEQTALSWVNVEDLFQYEFPKANHLLIKDCLLPIL